MARLEIRDVSCELGSHRVLDHVSLAVADGELVVIVGPSGCGKSTLLRIVAGLVPQSSGEIWIGGRCVDELEPRERDVAMVFQSYALYPHLTVRGNLEFPLRRAGRRKGEIARAVEEAAGLLGLSDLLARKPAQLSGGQMQRVALGRAIVRRPSLFLFDEPLSNLDAQLRAELRGEIARLHARLGATALYVTHDQAEAMTLGRRICVLNAGRVEQIGPPLEVYEQPATAFVAGFVGSPPMNLLRGRVSGGRVQVGAWSLPAPGLADGAEIDAGVRPHDLRLQRAEGPPALEIRSCEHLGAECHVELDLGPACLRAVLPAAERPRRGDFWSVSCPPESVHLFDRRSGLRLPHGKRIPSQPQS